MTLRVLFAIHGPPDPATAVFINVSSQAEYLRQLGHRVDVWSPADFSAGRWSRLQPLTMPIALATRDLRGYDVVIFHSHLAWAHVLKQRRRRSAHAPATVITFHGLEPLYHQAVADELARTGERLSTRFSLLHRTIVPRLLKLACRRADAVFCLNTREREFILAEEWSEPSRVVVVPNGVSAELLDIPRSYAPAARRLLFIGQWLRPKGTRYLAAAFDAIAARFSDVELTCAGTGAPAAAVLESFPETARPRVRVLDRFTRQALTSEITNADLFLFPTLSEGFSGALLEAMAGGLPIVTTAAGAAADLLTDGVNAAIVPFADAAALADRTAALIGDRVGRESLGGAARATARQYTWQYAHERFAEEIARVAAARS
jgi:glycosyltransferase involved in cell wall biosynthesis